MRVTVPSWFPLSNPFSSFSSQAPSEKEIILLGHRAWTLEGMAQWSDLKAPSLWVETLLCIVRLARKAMRGHLE